MDARKESNNAKFHAELQTEQLLKLERFWKNSKRVLECNSNIIKTCSSLSMPAPLPHVKPTRGIRPCVLGTSAIVPCGSSTCSFCSEVVTEETMFRKDVSTPNHVVHSWWVLHLWHIRLSLRSKVCIFQAKTTNANSYFPVPARRSERRPASRTNLSTSANQVWNTIL